jgi:hypothetical protein
MNGVTIAKLSWNKTGEIELMVKMPFNYNKTERPYEPLLKIFLVKKKFLFSIRGCFYINEIPRFDFFIRINKKRKFVSLVGVTSF